MKNSSMKPIDITLLGLLTACTHAGLVELGLEFFRGMKSDYKIPLQVEHHAWVVDLF